MVVLESAIDAHRSLVERFETYVWTSFSGREHPRLSRRVMYVISGVGPVHQTEPSSGDLPNLSSGQRLARVLPVVIETAGIQLFTISYRIHAASQPLNLQRREAGVAVRYISESRAVHSPVCIAPPPNGIFLHLAQTAPFRILEAIAPEPDGEDIDDLESTETASIIISGRPSSAVSAAGSSVPAYDSYRKRLAPLLDLEQRLIQLLSDPEDNDEREATHLPHGQLPQGSAYMPAAPPPLVPSHSLSSSMPTRPAPRITIPRGSYSSQPSPVTLSPGNEVTIPGRFNWKKPLIGMARNQSPKGERTGEIHGWWEDPHDPVHVMNRCAPMMTELWRDPKVQQRLRERRLRLEESSGL